MCIGIREVKKKWQLTEWSGKVSHTTLTPHYGLGREYDDVGDFNVFLPEYVSYFGVAMCENDDNNR